MISGLLILLLIAVFASLGIALMALWIWALICAIQNKGIGEGEKVGWVLAIVFFHFIGSILYLLIAHPKRNTPLLTTSAATPLARA